jgi:hypothetical protein
MFLPAAVFLAGLAHPFDFGRVFAHGALAPKVGGTICGFQAPPFELDLLIALIFTMPARIPPCFSPVPTPVDLDLEAALGVVACLEFEWFIHSDAASVALL